MSGRGGLTTGIYVVRDRTGDVYGASDDYREAARMRVRAADHLNEALACGHPLAAGWVRDRLPCTIEWMGLNAYAELIDDQGAPILGREPVTA